MDMRGLTDSLQSLQNLPPGTNVSREKKRDTSSSRSRSPRSMNMHMLELAQRIERLEGEGFKQSELAALQYTTTALVNEVATMRNKEETMERAMVTMDATIKQMQKQAKEDAARIDHLEYDLWRWSGFRWGLWKMLNGPRIEYIGNEKHNNKTGNYGGKATNATGGSSSSAAPADGSTVAVPEDANDDAKMH